GMDEANAFLTALTHRAPDEPTACRGWQVRDIVAHLAAGAREESELIETALRGGRPRPTRPFDEREAAYRATPYPELVTMLAGERARLSTAIDRLSATGGTVEFTGARLSAAEFRTHSRSELAIHRWDIVGDDDTGRRLLEQTDLTRHAIKILSTMTSLQESITSRTQRLADVPDDFVVRLRSPESSDVLIRLAPTPTLELGSPDSATPVVH